MLAWDEREREVAVRLSGVQLKRILTFGGQRGRRRRFRGGRCRGAEAPAPGAYLKSPKRHPATLLQQVSELEGYKEATWSERSLLYGTPR